MTLHLRLSVVVCLFLDTCCCARRGGYEDKAALFRLPTLSRATKAASTLPKLGCRSFRAPAEWGLFAPWNQLVTARTGNAAPVPLKLVRVEYEER